MKIEKNGEGTGFVLTNNEGDSLNVAWSEFWDIVRAGTEIETKSEVEEYLAQCPDISGHDLDRIRAFPKLVDRITEQVIQDRINDETGDQIYYAAEKCIKEHISEFGMEKPEKQGLDNIISHAEAKKDEFKPMVENKNIEHEI